ncbi:PREDICTED: putative sodium-coupled neutral amino acid transporter 9 [Ceratosolen solmsi marchali]|uniref:Sodium-coupled neutral amino acid transporter 9 n=1 Tax=Ceratosolen solmsi marchali TaxID=326594 RepID=A0AAJ6YGI3_9HYME|nr:PREDICTED: putative sodium-coupled neutral amino acid transporter 9 [Ceratosolen solmsi marchali]
MAERGLVHGKQPDTGSESTALLSSGCSSRGHQFLDFHGSGTSNVDESSRGSGSSFRFSSLTDETQDYGSISVLQAKRPAALTSNNRVSSSARASFSPNLECEKFYDIQNADLQFKGDVFDTDIGIEKKKLLREFFSNSLSNQLLIKDITEDIKPKQSSLVTIFSVWNTILGSSILTMPWGIYMAGFVPAMLLILAMSGLCLFTAYKLLQVHKYYGGVEGIEVTELSKIFLGSWAEYMAKIFSMSVLMGANIAYWILMSNFLYNSVNFFYDIMTDIPLSSVTSNKTSESILCPKRDILNTTINYEISYDNLGPIWDLYKTVPIFLALLVFPVLNFNTTTFFTKFNSLGTIAIIYLVLFVLIKSASWGINMDKAAWDDIWILRPTFPVLSGMLSLSFFIHNIIITIMQSNRNQHKNGRDLTIAYVLVTITYIIVGIAFYVCFPLMKICIEDNLLNNFQKTDGLTVGARIVLLFQLFTVYPLLAYMLRIQLLSSLFKTIKCRRSLTLLINFIIVAICILFAVFLPHIGTIIRYTGAISGLVYVFTLPPLLHLMISYRQGTITMLKVLCYICIPIIGLLNLISQFFMQTI